MRLTVKAKNFFLSRGPRSELSGDKPGTVTPPEANRAGRISVPLLLSSLVYFLFFLGHGASFTSLSPHMLQRFGDRASLIFFAGQAIFPFGYLFAGWVSDTTRRIRSLLILFLILQAPVQYILFAPDLSFAGSILLVAVSRFIFAAIMQLLSIAILEKLDFFGFSISRSAGTAGFLVVQIVMLLLEVYALANVSPEIQGGRGGQMGSAFFLLTACLAFVFPSRRLSRSPYFFKDAFSGIHRFGLLAFFLLSFVFYFSYQVIDNYLGGYLRQRGGMPFVYGGWAIAVLIEIPFMTYAERVVHRFGLRFLFLLAIGAGVLRFLVLSLDVAGKFPGPVLLQQVLHGVHFTGFYMGTVYLLRRRFPTHLFGTGMGLYMVIAVSLGGTSGSLILGDLVAEQFGVDPFAWIFGGALLVHVAAFFGFLFLSLARERGVASVSQDF